MSAAGTGNGCAGLTAAMLDPARCPFGAGLGPRRDRSADKDAAIAQSLAEMLRDARTVISDNEALINDPDIGDKQLTGEKVLAEADKALSKDDRNRSRRRSIRPRARDA